MLSHEMVVDYEWRVRLRISYADDYKAKFQIVNGCIGKT